MAISLSKARYLKHNPLQIPPCQAFLISFASDVTWYWPEIVHSILFVIYGLSHTSLRGTNAQRPRFALSAITWALCSHCAGYTFSTIRHAMLAFIMPSWAHQFGA